MELPHGTTERTLWSRRKANGNTKSGNASRGDPSRNECRADDGELLGPYETTYDLTVGYGVDRVIVNP
ncbi:MAG: hypothetical protein ACRENP_25265 [Longimicrobiales bacterium]